MLMALEQGVKGGVWFSLIDKVWNPTTLRRAFERVRHNGGAAGVDHVTCEQFAEHLDIHIEWLTRALRADRYVAQDVRRHWIPKPGRTELRPLGIPTVRDRTVQTAVRSVIEPIFERDFAAHSYGFRPGRGCKDALRRVATLLATGSTWVVDADLRKYFDTIPHDRLMARIRRRIADGRVLALLESWLKQGIMDGLAHWTPEAGTPQGAVISPLLANIYLDPLDHHMAASHLEMVRYADDFVILCRTEAEAHRALALVRQWTEENGLTLHPDKTRIVNAAEPGGFDFLGYHFERSGKRWPSRKAVGALRDHLRPLVRRSNGHSMEAIARRVNPILRGWFEYFKHGNPLDLLKVDAWLRMRLRSILWQRHRRHGVGRGRSHSLWPNAYFHQLGLFSLAAAHALAHQSARR
jgi:RNA-directed DNA polymerase